jgi:hypothetical protein
LYLTVCLAVQLQLCSAVNNPLYDSCICSAGPFSNRCVSFHQVDTAAFNSNIPFLGLYTNCYIGGQRCLVLSEGWRQVNPQSLCSSVTNNFLGTSSQSCCQTALNLYIDQSCSNIHLSSDYNLNTVDGVRDALAELDRV